MQNTDSIIKDTMSDIFGIDPGLITPSSDNKTLPNWDSISHMHLCIALERIFGLSFTDQHVLKMTNYPAIIEVVSGLLDKSSRRRGS